MENILTLEDFQNGERSLNLEGFQNLEKGMKETDFKQLFPESAFEIYSEEQLSAFIEKAQSEIIKGELEGIVGMVTAQISTLHKIRVKDESGEGSWKFIRKKSDQDIQKSHVSEAFQYSENFKFKKSGAEILDQMHKIKSKEEQEKTAAKLKMMLIQEKLIDMPKEEVSDYFYRGFNEKIGTMYRYSWKETKDSFDSDIEPSMGNVQQEYEAESALKMKYNKAVDKYIDSCVEACYLELYIQNINETSSYELTPQQAAVLQF